ncbi:cell wall integrity and stress response component 1-like [Lingula anatina]|uniref:Cell wall integrity and stress response component 1-like n=1 Tax=Lingula anatina TaxID=7574 RepID=A0A1S3JDG5_LINAN|nr:cell wall integrity and stress response component 1-like [Lingula anatina]|eukprot:XP_013408368.1 cell wall integrity and stress response component 1-like [Lingula anatina]
MATAPAEEHTFVLNTFDDLVNFTSNFSKALCSGDIASSTAAPENSNWYKHYQSKCAEPTTIQTTSSGGDTTVSSGHEITSVSSEDKTELTRDTKTNLSDVSDTTVSSADKMTSVSVKFGTTQVHTSSFVTSLTVSPKETKTNPTVVPSSKPQTRMPDKKEIGITTLSALPESATNSKEHFTCQCSGVDGVVIGIIAGIVSVVFLGGVAVLFAYLKKLPQRIRASMAGFQMEL